LYSYFHYYNPLMTKFHYIYKITNIIKNDPRKYYIGVRSSSRLPEEDIKYQSSSKILIPLLNETYTKEILSVWNSRKEAVEEEIRLHNKYNVDSNPLFYNQTTQTSTGFDGFSLTGELNPFYGKTHSSKQKAKWKEFRKGTNSGKDNPFYGKVHSEETKKLISSQWEGEAGKQRASKISQAMTGKKHKIVTCPHCDKSGGIANMKRYHFDNCRLSLNHL